MEDTNYGFFAMLDRMQYIARWALMRNSRIENIKEHSFDVAVIAQCLAMMYNRNNAGKEGYIEIDPYEAAALGLYHDCTEIITGDLPTPIKYRNDEIKKAYKEVESEAACTLVDLLPEEFRDDYLKLLDPKFEGPKGAVMKKIVKSADKISAYIKCIREESSGNKEFISAMNTLKDYIDSMEFPEANEFMDTYIPAYRCTIDQLNGKD